MYHEVSSFLLNNYNPKEIFSEDELKQEQQYKRLWTKFEIVEANTILTYNPLKYKT